MLAQKEQSFKKRKINKIAALKANKKLKGKAK